MAKPIVRPGQKTCRGCPVVFARQGESNRQWDAASLCPGCYREDLKDRIRRGSSIDENGCWLWQASTRSGYGQLSMHMVPTATHRLSYELFVGPIPDGLFVCHRCDVRRCNNPEHLFLGTSQDNMADMRAKGRGSRPPRRTGLQHHKARLSEEQITTIRERWRSRPEDQRSLAAEYGCSQSTIWRLVHRKTRTEP